MQPVVMQILAVCGGSRESVLSSVAEAAASAPLAPLSLPSSFEPISESFRHELRTLATPKYLKQLRDDPDLYRGTRAALAFLPVLMPLRTAPRMP